MKLLLHWLANEVPPYMLVQQPHHRFQLERDFSVQTKQLWWAYGTQHISRCRTWRFQESTCPPNIQERGRRASPRAHIRQRKKRTASTMLLECSPGLKQTNTKINNNQPNKLNKHWRSNFPWLAICNGSYMHAYRTTSEFPYICMIYIYIYTCHYIR